MPGVKAILVVRPGGQKVLGVWKQPDDQLKTTFFRREQAASPEHAETLGDERIWMYTPILNGLPAASSESMDWQRSGWISLEFDYARNMEDAMAAADWAGFQERRKSAQARGRDVREQTAANDRVAKKQLMTHAILGDEWPAGVSMVNGRIGLNPLYAMQHLPGVGHNAARHRFM